MTGDLWPEHFTFIPLMFSLLFHVSLLCFTVSGTEMTALTFDLSLLFLAVCDAKWSMTGWFDKEVLVKWQLYQVERLVSRSRSAEVWMCLRRSHLGGKKANLAICSDTKPAVSPPALLVKHEIFISCIFWGKALKGSDVDPSSLQRKTKLIGPPPVAVKPQTLFSVCLPLIFHQTRR